MEPRIGVLIAHCHDLYRFGLRSMIESIDDGDIQVVGVTSVAQKIPIDIRQLNVDVVVMGLVWDKDRRAGRDVIFQIKRELTGVWVIVVCDDAKSVTEVRAIGADLAMLRDTLQPHRLVESIKSRFSPLKNIQTDLKQPAVGVPNLDLRKRILELVNKGMNNTELQLVCFQLGVDFETLSGSTKTEKAMSLILYCESKQQLPDLFQVIKDTRLDLYKSYLQGLF